MPFEPIDESKQYDIRLTLTMPSRGRVIIEGNQSVVSKFWNNVQIEFIGQISNALKELASVKGEFEPVKIETPE